jgi:phosphoglycerate dehydrogenase-like enzyme
LLTKFLRIILLKNNSIRAACIDIFENEKPRPKNSRLYNFSNLIITSWSSWYSEHSEEQRMDLSLKNLERFINRKPLLNLVNKSQLKYG